MRFNDQSQFGSRRAIKGNCVQWRRHWVTCYLHNSISIYQVRLITVRAAVIYRGSIYGHRYGLLDFRAIVNCREYFLDKLLEITTSTGIIQMTGY